LSDDEIGQAIKVNYTVVQRTECISVTLAYRRNGNSTVMRTVMSRNGDWKRWLRGNYKAGRNQNIQHKIFSFYKIKMGCSPSLAAISYSAIHEIL
jgi:hypothetical protein